MCDPSALITYAVLHQTMNLFNAASHPRDQNNIRCYAIHFSNTWDPPDMAITMKWSYYNEASLYVIMCKMQKTIYHNYSIFM